MSIVVGNLCFPFSFSPEWEKQYGGRQEIKKMSKEIAGEVKVWQT